MQRYLKPLMGSRRVNDGPWTDPQFTDGGHLLRGAVEKDPLFDRPLPLHLKTTRDMVDQPAGITGVARKINAAETNTKGCRTDHFLNPET